MVLEEDIGVFSCGRLTSHRCKNKMIRGFGDTTLLDIFLSKLSKLDSNTFFAGYDEIFKEKCDQYNIDFVQRTKKSSDSEVANEIYNFVNDVNYKYLLMVNACIPFLKLETIKRFLAQCDDLKKPAFAVFKKNNYFMSLDEEPFNFSKNINMKR